MRNNNPDYFIMSLLGGLFAGLLCGLLPLILGMARRRQGLGGGGFAACAGVGLVGGLILAVPTAVVFAIIIGCLPAVDERRRRWHRDDYDDDDDRSYRRRYRDEDDYDRPRRRREDDYDRRDRRYEGDFDRSSWRERDEGRGPRSSFDDPPGPKQEDPKPAPRRPQEPPAPGFGFREVE